MRVRVRVRVRVRMRVRVRVRAITGPPREASAAGARAAQRAPRRADILLVSGGGSQPTAGSRAAVRRSRHLVRARVRVRGRCRARARARGRARARARVRVRATRLGHLRSSASLLRVRARVRVRVRAARLGYLRSSASLLRVSSLLSRSDGLRSMG